MYKRLYKYKELGHAGGKFSIDERVFHCVLMPQSNCFVNFPLIQTSVQYNFLLKPTQN
jgi:hypothetical protein